MKWYKQLYILALAMLPMLSVAQSQKINSYTFGEGYTFSGGDDYRINLRGYVQPYYEFKSYTDEDLNGTFQRFRLRRARLRLTGDAAQQKIDYRFQIDFSGTSETGDESAGMLMDAWIRYNATKRIRITVGQKVTPTDNRELLMGSQMLQLIERSRVTSSFGSIREFGVFVDGTFRTKNGMYFKPVVAVTNGDGGNVFTADHGGLKVGGRLDFLPFGLFTNFGQYRQGDLVRELSPKLVMGVTYSHNMGMSSRRGRNSGAILYLDEDGNEALPDYTKYGFDFMFKFRGFSVLGEFVSASATVPDEITQRVRNDGTTSENFEIDGEDNVENYVKNRMMIGQGYNIQMGYIFKNMVSVDARYCHISAPDYSFLNNGTFYNRPNYYTLGLTKYFGRSYGFKIQGSITYVDCADGSNDFNGLEMAGDEWIGRIMTTFSF